jgi:hypothetical protein
VENFLTCAKAVKISFKTNFDLSTICRDFICASKALKNHPNHFLVILQKWKTVLKINLTQAFNN